MPQQPTQSAASECTPPRLRYPRHEITVRPAPHKRRDVCRGVNLCHVSSTILGRHFRFGPCSACATQSRYK